MYRSQLHKYEQFCNEHSYSLVSIWVMVLTRYVAYLARFISACSINQYSNVIRIIHLELGYPNTLTITCLRQCWELGLKWNFHRSWTSCFGLHVYSSSLNGWGNHMSSLYLAGTQGARQLFARFDFVMSSSALQLVLFVNIATSHTTQFQESADLSIAILARSPPVSSHCYCTGFPVVTQDVQPYGIMGPTSWSPWPTRPRKASCISILPCVDGIFLSTHHIF